MGTPLEDKDNASRPPESAPPPPGVTAEAKVRTGKPGDQDSVRPLIVEIRARMAELVARELALREREQELERQARRLEREARAAARQEWSDSQERLRRRSEELDAQALELAARSNRLQELEARLNERQAALEQTQRDLAAQIKRLRARAQAYRALRQQDHQLLRKRIAVVRSREKDLQRRIRLAYEEITRQREDLEAHRQSLQQRVSELESRERELEARRGKLEMEIARLQQQADELRARQKELQAQRSEVASRREELTQTSRNLEQQREELARQRRQLEQRWQQDRARRHELARQAEELEAQRRILAEQQAAHDQRLERLRNYEEQLRARAAMIESENRRLAEIEAEINERREALDAAVAQTERALDEAEERREEALALREQAEAREAESRQRQLALELEQEELARQRAALEEAYRELDARRADRERELREARTALAAQVMEVQKAQRAIVSGPGRWWLRSAVLGLLVGLAASAGWWFHERPVYRAEVAWQLNTTSSDRAESLLAHAVRLEDPATLSALFTEDAERRAWDELASVAPPRVTTDPEAGLVRLAVESPQAGPLQTLLATLARAYVEKSTTWNPTPGALERGERLTAERREIAASLAEWESRRQTCSVRLESLPTAAERDRLAETVSALQKQFAEQKRALAEHRMRLEELEAGPPPRGSVLPADFEQALADDAMYQADLEELHVTAAKYRSEAVVALLLVNDPAAQLKQALEAFADVISEQQALEQPGDVQAALQDVAAMIPALTQRLAEFVKSWRSRIEAMQALEPTDNLVDMVQQATSAAQAALGLCEQVGRLRADILARLDRLDQESDGGTRVVVVGALLRSELAKLAEVESALCDAASQTDPAQNFQLDALDRQLRGLQARLERREDSVRQILQYQADERARREHAQQVSEIRSKVAEAENQRDTLLVEWTTKLETLRRLDEDIALRRKLEAEEQAAGRELEALKQRLAELDKELSRLKAGHQAPRLEAQPVRVVQVTGEHRGQHAAIAGAGGLLAAWVLCFLTVVRNPLRRRHAWAALLNELESTPPEPPGADGTKSASA